MPKVFAFWSPRLNEKEETFCSKRCIYKMLQSICVHVHYRFHVTWYICRLWTTTLAPVVRAVYLRNIHMCTLVMQLYISYHSVSCLWNTKGLRTSTCLRPNKRYINLLDVKAYRKCQLTCSGPNCIRFPWTCLWPDTPRFKYT